MQSTVVILIFKFLILLKIVSPVDCVINCTSALKNEFPSTVRLVCKSGKNNIDQPLCTGVILNEILILTAGSCLKDIQDLTSIEVIAGDYHRINNDGTEQRSHVVDKYYHPLIDNVETMRYNLVILRLAETLVFDNAVQKTPLPETNFDAKGYFVFAGWGADTEEPLKYPNILKIFFLQKFDKKTYKNLTGDKKIKFSTFFKGTVGGGAFYRDGCKKVLAGILSYAIDSGPLVFTRINEKVVSWINDIINNTWYYLNLAKTETKNNKPDKSSLQAIFLRYMTNKY